VGKRVVVYAYLGVCCSRFFLNENAVNEPSIIFFSKKKQRSYKKSYLVFGMCDLGRVICILSDDRIFIVRYRDRGGSISDSRALLQHRRVGYFDSMFGHSCESKKKR
jgi:hypothetical protein